MKHIKAGHRRQSIMQGFAWQSMADHLPINLVTEYKEAFQTLDQDNDGKISIPDLSMVIYSIGITLTEMELLDFVRRVVDLQELSLTENCLGFSEFLAIIAFIITDCVSEKEATRIFREFDKDGDGFITERELRDLMLRVGDDVSDDEVQEMMKVADTDGDGKVSLAEFIFVMNSAHSCADSDSNQQMPMPRILIEKEQESTPKEMNKNPGEIALSFRDRLPLPAVEEETDNTERELRFSRKNSISSRRPSICCKNAMRRKNNVLTWINSTELSKDQLGSTCDLENAMSSTSSILSASTPSNNSLKKRRKSSITKTLKNGRDRLIATARTLRRISR